ncbi:MAG TPA: JAB domain-containing protein, partial [Syntrophales bacterium]|nr:JAB domain-containing protein [Syntrophales bacterium]
TPEEVIDAYSSKLDDIAGLMQEKEANSLEARRGRYETPGQTTFDFGTEGATLFGTTPTSPTPEKTQPAPTSEGEGATKEPWQMVPAEYVGDAARDEKAVELAAHPMHVKRALEEGKTVPLEVLDKYRNNYWAQKAIERLHGEAALKEPEAGYGEAGLDNVSKTKDNAAMSKDKGTADIPAETTPKAVGGKIPTLEEYIYGDNQLSKLTPEKWKEQFGNIPYQKDGTIKIYRGAFLKDRYGIKEGDWVTLDKNFAKENYAGKGGKIFEKEVPINELMLNIGTSQPGKSELIWKPEASLEAYDSNGKYEKLADKYNRLYPNPSRPPEVGGQTVETPTGQYGEAGLDNVSKTKDNAAMSKDKGTADIPPETTPQAEAGKYSYKDIYNSLPDNEIVNAYKKTNYIRWQMHGTREEFLPENARSITPDHEIINKGYSAFNNIEEALDYHHFSPNDDDWVVMFNGEKIGSGVDNEPLVIPDMKSVHWFRWDDVFRSLSPKEWIKSQFPHWGKIDKDDVIRFFERDEDKLSVDEWKQLFKEEFGSDADEIDTILSKLLPNPSRPPEVGGQTVETPTGQYGEPTAISRSAWSPDTEKSVQHTTVIAMKAQPGYKAAKEGDFVEGVKLALSLIKPQIINNLKNKLPQGARVIVVPVQSLEAQGENAIPAGMAHVIADMTGWQVAEDIFQVNKVEHTDKNALERLLNQAVYDGPVEPGTLYLIVDDVVTQGGTLANLKGFIEAKGGKVIGIHTLGAAMFSTNLKVSPATVEKLKNTYGQNLDSVLSYVYGGKTNVEHITESEARTFLNKKDELLDAARAGRLEADIQGRTPEGQGISGRGKAEAAGQLNEPEKTYRDNAGIAAQAVSELGESALLQSVEAVPGAGVRARGRTAGGEPVRVPVQEAGRAEAAPRRAVTLGKTVSDLKELKSVRLRGVEVPTWNAVYSALRIVRNANVEVMNVLYRGRTSERILYNEAYSCRLPGSVENVNPSLLAMNAVGEANKLSRLNNEEVEIILAHNHPSGDITTSAADQRFTKEAAAAIATSRGNFAGHIVIDHNKYSLIYATGETVWYALPDVPAEYRNDPLLTVPVPHQALGENVTMPDHVALIAKDINRGEHYFTVLLRSGTKIRGIVNVPLDILDDLKTATEFIHELAVQHGAQDVFAYREEFTSRQRSILGQMIYQNTLRDAVENTSGFAQNIVPNTDLLFGKKRTAYEAQKLEGSPQEIKGEGGVRQVDAWHGGRPLVGGKFSTEYIGTGEGNQAFGWGLYFTTLKDIGEYYANRIGGQRKVKVRDVDLLYEWQTAPAELAENMRQVYEAGDAVQHWRDQAEKYKADFSEEIQSQVRWLKTVSQLTLDKINKFLGGESEYPHISQVLHYIIDNATADSVKATPTRNLYKVILHEGKQPGEYTWLEWEERVPDSIYKKMEDSISSSSVPEMRERSHKLIDLLKWKISRRGLHSNKGSELYRELVKEFGSDKAASLFLLRAGIDGIKYPAGTLSGAKTDAYNYVVFDENAVTVKEHALFEEEAPYGEEEDDSFDFGANIEKEIEANPEKHISLDFKDHLDGYIAGLYNMVASGEPGKRLALEGANGADDVISWGSTYPEFMNGRGWSAKEVLAALKHAEKGEKTTDKQKEIIRAALHQATDMFFEDMERWMPNLSAEAWEKMEASVEPAIDDLLNRYYREKRERAAEREKIARTTKITKSQYAWEKEKERAKTAAWIKGFKSRQAEVEELKAQIARADAKLRTQIDHINKIFERERDKEKAWKEAERIHHTEIKKLSAEIKRLKERLAKAQEAAAPRPRTKRLSRKGQIRIVTGQVLADDEITLREMDALKAQIRMEAAAAKDAFRAGNKEGLAKARAKYQALLDIQRIRRQQRADIRKMIAQMKAVAAKAGKLPPEYKQAINDLLAPWDMARLTEKNRVRLQAIRTEIETNENADFPPAVLETLKRLDKRPIRDLSYDEIKAIHQAVMHYAALGRNKLNGMAAQKKIVREMVRGTVIAEMKGAEAEPDRIDIRYTQEKKFRGFLQKARNQFGIHLISWEALVESVSGPRS